MECSIESKKQNIDIGDLVQLGNKKYLVAFIKEETCLIDISTMKSVFHYKNIEYLRNSNDIILIAKAEDLELKLISK